MEELKYQIDLLNAMNQKLHFNSDVFCIGIYDPCGARSVEMIYKTIRERLKKPFKLSDGQFLGKPMPSEKIGNLLADMTA